MKTSGSPCFRDSRSEKERAQTRQTGYLTPVHGHGVRLLAREDSRGLGRPALVVEDLEVGRRPHEELEEDDEADEEDDRRRGIAGDPLPVGTSVSAARSFPPSS